MRFDHRRVAQAAVCVLMVGAAAALGQGNTVDEIAKYRAALQDGNPAEVSNLGLRGVASMSNSLGVQPRAISRVPRSFVPLATPAKCRIEGGCHGRGQTHPGHESF